ncbi:MAG: hypothetical protein ACLFSE_12830, partial [Spirochaetia bacterium]
GLNRLVTAALVKIDIPLFLWPAAGAVITFGLVYPFARAAAGEGMPAYMSGLTDIKPIFLSK